MAENKPKDRGPVNMSDFTSIFRRMLRTPESKHKSENREPTRDELNRRWRLTRRES